MFILPGLNCFVHTNIFLVLLKIITSTLEINIELHKIQRSRTFNPNVFLSAMQQNTGLGRYL